MRHIIVFIVACCCFSSCGPGLQIFSDYDKTVNINNYTTYSWLDLKSIEGKAMNPLYYNELNNKRIKEAVDKEMLASNISYKENDASLLLHYHIVVEDKTSITAEPANMQYRNSAITAKTNVYQYREGTLIIDMMDTKTNELVWRGWATDVITSSVKKHPEQAIQNAVKQIFKVFANAKLKKS